MLVRLCSRCRRLEYEASKAPKALPTVNASQGGSAVVQDVLALVSKVAGITTDADAPLLSAGLTSMHAMQLRAHLQESAGEGTQLPTTVVFEFPTARAIAGLLSKSAPVESAPAVGPTLTKVAGERFDAIVGSSWVLPEGNASA